MARSIGRLRYALYRTTSWRVGIRLHLGWGFINAPLLTFTYRVKCGKRGGRYLRGEIDELVQFEKAAKWQPGTG